MVSVPLEIVHHILGIVSQPLSVDWQWRVTKNDMYPLQDTWRDSPYVLQERDAKAALAACALVSKVWASTVRPYIFATTAFRFFTSPETEGERRLEDIVQRICSTEFPNTLVQKLRLIMLPESFLVTCELRHLQTIFTQCDNLRVLELIEVRAEQQLNGPLPGYIPRNLDRLYCSNRVHCPIITPNDLVCILACFGDIKTLQLEHSSKNTILENADETVAVPDLRVRNLDAEYADIPISLAMALRKSPTFQSNYLKTLNITITNFFPRPGPDLLRNAARACVEDLRFTLRCMFKASDEIACNLSEFTCLRKLTLAVPADNCLRDQNYSAWPYLVRLLSSLVSKSARSRSTVQSVTLWIEDTRRLGETKLDDDIPTMVHDCSQILINLDQVLNDIPSLTRLCLGRRYWRHAAYLWTEDDRKLLMSAFPLMTANRRLEFLPLTLASGDSDIDD